MSSLQRTRSLRKPTLPPPAERVAKSAGTDISRSGSPSRLPVKPSSRPTSVIAPSSSTATKNTTTTGVSRSTRPVSATLTRSTSLSRKKNVVTAQEPKKETSRYPPLSSANRPTVKTRPTSAGSGSVDQTRRNPTHIRAKSTMTSLTSATSLRPPSRDRNTTTTTTVRSGHGRNVSVDKGPSTPAKQSAALPPGGKAQAQPRLRPAFSTLQQHYSPAKAQAPKPLTSAILAPPSPSKLPANIAASAETSKLQGELVQLHLLHRDSQTIQAQWQASAREKLGAHFEQVSQESKLVSQREQSVTEGDNILALRRWARSGRSDIEEKIQVLDEMFTSLWALIEPAGRYARIVRRFERWVDNMCDAEEARCEPGKMLIQGQDSLFIGELDASWKEECTGVTRRLDSWRAQLAEMDDLVASHDSTVSSGVSSLERMLAGAKNLVYDMLAELHAMEEIEQQALAREDEWIERVNREGDEDIDTPGAGAVWRVM